MNIREFLETASQLGLYTQGVKVNQIRSSKGASVPLRMKSCPTRQNLEFSNQRKLIHQFDDIRQKHRRTKGRFMSDANWLRNFVLSIKLHWNKLRFGFA